MSHSIYEFSDYKLYLNYKIQNAPSKGRGLKLKMAEFLSCQNTYISQVLNGDPNFSLEQAAKLNLFFEHTKDESKFFLLLVHHHRAGSAELKAFYYEEMEDLIIRNSDLKKRTNVKASLKNVDQEIYYSNWLYSAVHILVTIKEFQTLNAISKKLNINKENILTIIDFLIKTGLVVKTGSLYTSGNARIHLSKDSPQIQRHHTNWRLKAIQSLDINNPKNLHFSNVVSMSEKDVVRVREIFIKAIDEARKIIKESPEEKLQSIGIDFFEL
jgi:uncharacterized protein (TIGR02147 family)